MSSDNYIVIRKDGKTGEFVPVMGFDSDDKEPTITPRHKRYANLDDALDFAHGEYTEYGVSIHAECSDADLNPPATPITPTLE